MSIADSPRSRPFKEVSVTAVLAQKGKDRDDKPERVCEWRSNLSALSQLHNLYFIACSKEIHIHRPTFPEQSLSSAPLLILSPPVTRPELRGYIDSSHPHSINHILVGFLGHEEVLLAACDDGDVIGYFVNDILKHATPTTTQTDINREIRPFFHENVEMSAWGLAIHREARLIAVSANTHRVTVYALALTSNPSPSDYPDDFRDILRTLELPDVGNNIPAIQFNNTGSDPKGRWLLSTTLTGETYLWDISQPKNPPTTIGLGFCHSTVESPFECRCMDRYAFPHSTWNAAFLDPRSFKNTDRIEVALGTGIEEKSKLFWDITKSKFDIPLASRASFRNPGWAQPPSFVPGELEGDNTAVGGITLAFIHEPLPHNEEVGSPEPPSSPPGQDLPSSPPGQDFSSNLDESSENPPIDAPEDTNSNISDTTVYHGGFELAPITLNSQYPMSIPQPMPTHYLPQISILPRASQRPQKQPYFRSSNWASNSSEYPDCPIFIVAKKDIFMVQSLHDCEGDADPPIISSNEPLPKSRPRGFVGGDFVGGDPDRLYFLEQIPELGVVIVGSNGGLVAILTLTQNPEGHSLIKRSDPASPDKPIFGFRLDHILPFPRQEKEGLRSHQARLLGIATSPVQGMLGEKEGQRRWRLLLYYSDHAVLAYEIGKVREPQNQGVETLVL